MFRRDELITFDYLITCYLEPTTFTILRRKAVDKKTEAKSDGDAESKKPGGAAAAASASEESTGSAAAAKKGSSKQQQSAKARKATKDGKEKEAATKDTKETSKETTSAATLAVSAAAADSSSSNSQSGGGRGGGPGRKLSSGSRGSRGSKRAAQAPLSPAELSALIGAEFEIVTRTVSLKPFPALIPRYAGFDAQPKYLIVGGVVFTTLTFPLILEGRVNLSAGMVENAMLSYKQHTDQDLVVLLKILKHEVNYGYDIPACEQLTDFNGKAIHSLKQLAELVDAALQNKSLRHLVFTFGAKKDKIVLDRLQVLESEKQILTTHHIPSRSN